MGKAKKSFQIGQSVKYKVGRGFGTGTVTAIYTESNQASIQTNNGKNVLRSFDAIKS